MRFIIIVLLVFTFASARSQTVINTIPFNAWHPADSSIQKHKWFVTSYAGISGGVTFFKGGSLPFLAAPFGLQLNRKLNNNLIAFANVTAAPAYTGINPFVTGFNKTYEYNPYKRFGAYSSASLGLMYINDSRTFSISGSFSVERSSNPLLPFYTGNPHRQANVTPAAR